MICLEHCGDGIRVSNQFPCDDGNKINGDGCSENCMIENNWACEGGSSNSRDYCYRNFIFFTGSLNRESNYYVNKSE